MGDTAPLTLPGGLSHKALRDMAALIGEICGAAPASPPWLAPALLFSDPDVQRALSLPRPDADHLLVQDYQGVEYAAPFPPDTDLTAKGETERRADGVDLAISLASGECDICTLSTRLRLFPAMEIARLKPAVFRPDALPGTQWSAPLVIDQPQVDRYLHLSGDDNPIHADRSLAAAIGLENTIVPGLLLIAAIQPPVEAALPGSTLISLKARFLSPLLTGRAARTGLQDRGRDAKTGRLRRRAYLLGTDDRGLAIADLLFA